MGTYRDTRQIHRNTRQGYTWTYRVLDTEINSFKDIQRTVRTEWDNDIKCQVRGLMGRGPAVCWFPKTKRKGSPLTTYELHFKLFLNERMSDSPKGSIPGEARVGSQPIKQESSPKRGHTLQPNDPKPQSSVSRPRIQSFVIKPLNPPPYLISTAPLPNYVSSSTSFPASLDRRVIPATRPLAMPFLHLRVPTCSLCLSKSCSSFRHLSLTCLGSPS